MLSYQSADSSTDNNKLRTPLTDIKPSINDVSYIYIYTYIFNILIRLGSYCLTHPTEASGKATKRYELPKIIDSPLDPLGLDCYFHQQADGGRPKGISLLNRHCLKALEIMRRKFGYLKSDFLCNKYLKGKKYKHPQQVRPSCNQYISL
jgi:hypothetical protein